MAATDTVVGIIGAVLLAAVMVGVFVYEYNNAPDGTTGKGGMDNASRLDAFKHDARYKALNATGDLDHDGQQNYLDWDIDGDNLNNTKDNETVYAPPAFTGSAPAPTPPAMQGADSTAMTLVTEMGVSKVHFTITWTIATPSQISGQVVTPNLTLKVNHPDGDSESCNSKTYSGTQGTCSFDTSEAEVGAYTFTVSGIAPQNGNANFSIAALVSY